MPVSTTTYTYNNISPQETGTVFAFSGIMFLFIFAVFGLMLASMWKIFVKANKPGWTILIPGYNLYALFELAFGNGWMFLLMFVPFANFIVMLLYSFKLAKIFGKTTGFALGMVFLPVIFYPLLAFGDANYQGENNLNNNQAIEEQTQIQTRINPTINRNFDVANNANLASFNSLNEAQKEVNINQEETSSSFQNNNVSDSPQPPIV